MFEKIDIGDFINLLLLFHNEIISISETKSCVLGRSTIYFSDEAREPAS